MKNGCTYRGVCEIGNDRTVIESYHRTRETAFAAARKYDRKYFSREGRQHDMIRWGVESYEDGAWSSIEE